MSTVPYWYISDAKMANLSAGGVRAWLKNLAGTLRVTIPVVSVEVSGKPPAERSRVAEQLEARIRKERVVKDVSEIGSQKPAVFFSFEGQGARLIDDGAFWVATASKGVGLLLVGSARHAIGGGSSEPDRISPSADPLGAVKKAFASAGMIDGGAASPLAYVWQEVFGSSGEGVDLPVIRGIAVYAASAAMKPGTLGRVNGVELLRLVLGSPLFIAQV